MKSDPDSCQATSDGGFVLKDDLPDLITKYDIAVPRYTSYPTAVQFKPGIKPSFYADQLSKLPEGRAVSLYLHIPFCQTLCYYCGCCTKVVNSYDIIRDYVDKLLQEIEIVTDHIGRRQPISHIHWGGGTPNYLHSDDIARVLNLIKKQFTVLDDAEIAMEIDPRLLNKDFVGEAVKLGINRASLGVQDFNEDVQNAINRVQPYDMVEKCVRWLREAGIRKINFDLLYGLPFQNEDIIQKNVEKAVALAPDRISLFGYAHVPWVQKRQKLLEQYPMPNAQERYRLFETAKNRLCAHGYRPVGIDHFSRADDDLYNAWKEKRLHRNFQGYTSDDAGILIGFGASSISSLPQAYVQNDPDVRTYRKRIEDGILPVHKGYTLTEDDLLRRKIIESLMCYFEVDLQQYYEDVSFFSSALDSMKKYETDGLVAIDGGRITVSDKGRPFTRLIAACFDVYWAPEEVRHAQAV